MTLKAGICAINDGSKTERTGPGAFCVVDLREMPRIAAETFQATHGRPSNLFGTY